MAFSIRRIVTGHDPGGQAVVSMDTVIESRPGRLDTGVHVQEYWQTDSMPPALSGGDAVAEGTGVTPKPGGTIMRVLQIPPGSGGELHRTDTLDYFVVMDGEIEMTLDDDKFVPLRKGDTVVMRSTNHGWRNRSTRPCVLWEILIDAKGPAA